MPATRLPAVSFSLAAMYAFVRSDLQHLVCALT